jgi:penicillin-binding protein 1A
VTTTIPKPARSGPKHAPKKAQKPQKKKGFFRRYWWAFVLTPVLALLGVLLTLVYVYAHLQLPERLPPIQSTYVYASDGKTLLATLHGAENRTVIPFTSMPATLREAVISVEDHGFYQHHAIDPIGILRAAYTDIVKREVVQGGSTITQQLVKNVYAGTYVENGDGTTTYEVPPRTIGQKVREVLLSIKLENKLSKDQILAQYLNTIYFGHGAYGVEAAAKTYFGVDAADLTTWQSATLAGLITSPSYYDPYVNPEGAIVRRNYALDQMANYGYVPDERAAQLKDHKIGILADDPSKQLFTVEAERGHSQYFVEYAKQRLIDKYGDSNVFGGGYRVTTSLDLNLQQAAWQAVSSHLPDKDDPEAALVSIDPRTGQIVAMVGGRNYGKSQVNLATTGMKGFAGSGRQAGSAFKPFTLTAAMREHYNLHAYWHGPSSIEIPNKECYFNGEPWTVSNASDSEAGTFTLESATWHSVNTVFAQVAVAVGPENIVQAAHDLGIRAKLGAVCSITLGTLPVAPLEMTNAYATLAANGMRRWATPLLAVDTRRGKAVADLKDSSTVAPQPQRVLDANDAALVNQTLLGVVRYGTGTAAAVSGHDVAGKTGTAQNYVDAWFCGYTPQLATCVWVGYPKTDTEPLVSVEGVPAVFGGTIPAAIFHEFMTTALQGMPNKPFPEPRTTSGYTVGPQTPVPSPAPPPSPTPKPTKSPEPSPTRSPQPTGTPSPSESPPPQVRRIPGPLLN